MIKGSIHQEHIASVNVSVPVNRAERHRKQNLIELKEKKTHQQWSLWGLPGGSAVKNPPANAGDTGSIPDPRRSHMLWGSRFLTLQWLCSGAREPNYGALILRLLGPECPGAWGLSALEPLLRNKRNHHSKRPVPRTWRAAPDPSKQRQARAAAKTQHSQK